MQKNILYLREPTLSRMENKTMSIRAYARYKSVDESSVRYWIEQGHLKGCINRSNPKRPQINVAKADAALAVNLNGLAGNAAPRITGADQELEEPKKERRPRLSVTELKRLAMETDLKAKSLKLKVQQGLYVETAAVYAELFKMGQEIRQNLMALPDRNIDEILAAPDRHTAYTILSEAIAVALEQLTDTSKREFKTRK